MSTTYGGGHGIWELFILGAEMPSVRAPPTREGKKQLVFRGAGKAATGVKEFLALEPMWSVTPACYSSSSWTRHLVLPKKKRKMYH